MLDEYPSGNGTPGDPLVIEGGTPNEELEGIVFGSLTPIPLDEDPLFFIQVGTDGNDALHGVDDEINVLVGLDGDDDLNGKDNSDIILAGPGDDSILGRHGIDVIVDGFGDDKINAGGDDDIVIIKGGEKDRADGGEGHDLFMIAPSFFENGEQDRLKILNYDPHEDYIDIGIGQIAHVRELNKEVQITFEGDHDVMVVRGVNKFEDIKFLDLGLTELPDLLDLIAETLDEVVNGEEGDDNGEGHGAGDGQDPGDNGDDPDIDIVGNVFETPDDGFKLIGTDEQDTFIFRGGETASALGAGGGDVFYIAEELVTNGQADKVKIRDYDPLEDVVDISVSEITNVRELNNRTQVFIGDEGDFVEFVGITDFNDITFDDIFAEI